MEFLRIPFDAGAGPHPTPSLKLTRLFSHLLRAQMHHLLVSEKATNHSDRCAILFIFVIAHAIEGSIGHCGRSKRAGKESNVVVLPNSRWGGYSHMCLLLLPFAVILGGGVVADKKEDKGSREDLDAALEQNNVAKEQCWSRVTLRHNR